ncbi:MAG TPA: prolyl oligopeptidase family serine peptidase [Steroidobacteraceae bacterium]|nr:prolyl oligopeptidase family serine peptidase [Steroidobacteraceae bacterium]
MPTNPRYGVAVFAGAFAALLVACTATKPRAENTPQPAPSLQYPAASRGNVVDDYFGTKVADPYRAFEDAASPATRDWVAAENAVSQPYLERLPQRAWLGNRLKQLWTYERFGVPRREAGKYFYLRNDGTQDQSVLFVADSLTATPRVLVDPNGKRDDATIALSQWEPSPNGEILAYALSDGGTDWNTWHFRRVADGTDLPVILKYSKFWNVSWARDSAGVYYSRYPLKPNQSADDARGDDSGRPDVYFHALGDEQSADKLVYKVTDHPTHVPSVQVTEDGRYLIIGLFDGYESNAWMVQDLRSGAKPQPLFPKWDALYNFLGSKGDEFFFQSTKDAPRGRVIAIRANDADPAHWRSVVPQAEFSINNAAYIGGRIVVEYTRDARSLVRIFDADGSAAGEVKLPGLGTAAGLQGSGTDSEAFFSYSDYLSPTRILRLDVASNAVTDFRTPTVPADFSPYVTEQVFYASKDGTRVPMFITRRKDAPRDGNRPVMLYGYGGFNIVLSPAFSPAIQGWLEMGGVYAVANLRGGGEYGEEWHQAGTKLRKQNVFDDFIAAGEYLVAQKYTNPKRLAIFGRSNGGLLVGAALTQRPDLFGAALPGVGVMDMLRYQTASANARQWSSDLGLSENADEFKAIRAYSPVHNVKPGTCYPPTLVTTADRDDRVVPWHSYKFAAELQHAQGCANPVMIRIETRAGHGAGKPVWMQIEDVADQFGFVANALGMPAP